MSDAPDTLDAFRAPYLADKEGFNPEDFRVIWGRAFADRASALETIEERSTA
jgi:hypothetical protein